MYLVIAETSYYLDSRLQFTFEPDTDIDAKLQINIDVTVAMPCGRIGADILDSTNQHMIDFDSLTEEDTWWELTQEQRTHFEALKHMNSYLREEYHAIHELLWKSNQVTLYSEMPKRYVRINLIICDSMIFVENCRCIAVYEHNHLYHLDHIYQIMHQMPAVFMVV